MHQSDTLANEEVQTVKTKRFEMRLSDREYEMIREKMKLSKMQNMSAFMRKMSLDEIYRQQYESDRRKAEQIKKHILRRF